MSRRTEQESDKTMPSVLIFIHEAGRHQADQRNRQKKEARLPAQNRGHPEKPNQYVATELVCDRLHRNVEVLVRQPRKDPTDMRRHQKRQTRNFGGNAP